MVIEFLANNMGSVVLSLITAGALGFCRWTWKQMKAYRELLDERERRAFREEITGELSEEIERQTAPIINDIEELRAYIRNVDLTEKHQMQLIIASYRFRLIQLCKIYIKQGYMTQDQYDQLTEFYALYEGLGGNGQAKEYYDKAIVLPVKDLQ